RYPPSCALIPYTTLFRSPCPEKTLPLSHSQSALRFRIALPAPSNLPSVPAPSPLGDIRENYRLPLFVSAALPVRYLCTLPALSLLWLHISRLYIRPDPNR